MSEPARKMEQLLVEQRQALSCYLDALLNEKPMYLPVPVAPIALPRVVEPIDVVAVEVVAPPVVAVPLVVPAAPPAVVEVAAAPAPTTTVVEAIAPPAVATETQAAIASSPAVPAAGIPAWGAEPFQTLLLKVQGLTLALPLVKLNRILPWTDPTHLPGYLPWLLGIVRYLDQNVRVVDTAALVMPEIVEARKTASAADAVADAAPPARHIVLIGDGRWGLVCDDVSTVITIDPAKVRWRSSRTKRPWLAGTAVEHLCAVLDAEQLAVLLNEGCPELPG